MDILLIGQGGREHALAKMFSRSEQVKTIYAYPGNPGILSTAKCQALVGIQNDDDLVSWCQEHHLDWVMIGPEQPLVDGLSDRLREIGLAVLGPSKSAAVLEGSKIQSKKWMSLAKIPTADWVSFQDTVSAKQFLSESDWGSYIVKSDSLAAGKGVVVCSNAQQAQKAVYDILDNPHYPVQSSEILIEKKLEGQEMSAFALCDGEDFVFLGTACDYKRLQDGDVGPNTGGMGSYSPCHWASESLIEKIKEQTIAPLLKVMKDEGTPYQGILFVGLMVKDQNPWVIEYNIRLGDPETQSLLYGRDLTEIFALAALQKLDTLQNELKEQEGHSIHIVLAAPGYPGTQGTKIETGIPLHKTIEQIKNIDELFCAGIKTNEKGELYSAGGRVWGISCHGPSLEAAKGQAYQLIDQFQFKNAQYRRDIGA